MTKQIHLAAHFPGVNNTTVWSDPAAGSHIEFDSFRQFAQTAERGKFDFLFLAEGLRLREQNGLIYDLDVVGRPDLHGPGRPGRGDRARRADRHDQLHVQRALRGSPPVRQPRSSLRRPGGVERGHLLGLLHRGELPARRLPGPGRPLRAGQDLPGHGDRAVDSWRGDEILADKDSGQFMATAAPGSFRHRDTCFDIAGHSTCRAPAGPPGDLPGG